MAELCNLIGPTPSQHAQEYAGIELKSIQVYPSWLTTMPLEEHGFSLHKGAFVDALALRYGWIPSNTPTSCVCEANFTVEHMLSCPRGGFPTIRHNEIRDIRPSFLDTLFPVP